MKITRIDAFPFRLPLRRKFRWASLQIDLGGFVYVRIETDEGLIGHGEATALPDWGGDLGRPGGETQSTVISMIKEVISPVLTGADPLNIEAAHREMTRVLRGHHYAKCAVDIALHDILGKATNMPLYRLLGGRTNETVPVAHMVGIMPHDEALTESVAAVDDGLRALQIKGGEDGERDIKLVKAIRDAVGSDVFIRLDANQGYRTWKNALNLIERLEEAGASMIEQPVDGRREMAQVTSRSRLPIIADESCWDSHEALQVASERCSDAISIYLAKAKGFAGARRVAAVAEAAQMPCDVNGSIESGIGNAANVHFALAAGVVTLPAVIPISAPAGTHPNAAGGNYYEDDVLTEPMTLKDGGILPLEKPGLGIEIDENKLESFREN